MKEMIKDKLYSFDEQVRVELGPQIIELDCTSENLDDTVTHPQYRIGGVDAFGEPITQERIAQDGTKMNCVDWRSKHVPQVWKVYQLQDDTDPKSNMKQRFVKVNELEGKAEALDYAKNLVKEG